MRHNEILKRFILSVFSLSICLVLLWVAFYYLTLHVIRRNLRLQAETASEAIMGAVEEELLRLENGAWELGRDPAVERMVAAADALSFYQTCVSLAARDGAQSSALYDVDQAVVFHPTGAFYRLKGRIPNTALRRIFWLIQGEDRRVVTVSSNDRTYIGICMSVHAGETGAGFVVLLREQEELERLFDVYGDLDYLGVALLSDERILCAGREVKWEELPEIRRTAVFVREKEIGLSGLRLLVWCEDSIAPWLSVYFRVAMPVTVLVLLAILMFFVRYVRRHMVEPIELEKEHTLLLLLKKQISAHFTVNTLNVVRALVNKGDKEAAAHICSELSVLLRYANAGDEYISLSGEFYVLKQYVGIMQIRRPGCIGLELEENDSFHEVEIPRMLLQPIVENAIFHGLAGEKGTISISAALADDAVTVRIADDGRGMDEAKLEELKCALAGADADAAEAEGLGQIALRNIERRIRLVCGPEYGLTIRSAVGEGTEVLVRLPLCEAG